jgi:hypothetical protein
MMTKRQYFAFSNFVGSSVPVPDQGTSKHDASKRYKLTIVIVDRTVITERDGKERFKLMG